jgi:hypothetical protein
MQPRSLRDQMQYKVQCLKDRRESFEDHWRDIADHVMPRAYRWLDEHWSERGNKANKKIVDPTATLSLRAMEAAFSASITPTSRPWKKLSVRGDLAKSYQVKTYLEETSDLMDAAILDSNFYQEAGKLYAMTGLFGTGAMLIEEDEDEDFRCETLPTGSYWLGCDHKRRVNEFAREIDMTVRQMADAFGYENLSERHQSCLDSGKSADSEVVKVTHWIGPNEEYGPCSCMSAHKYVSIYMDCADHRADAYLRKSGYDEFPVIAPRWKVMGDDVYGLDCPGMIALGHIKELQHANKQVAKAIEKQVSPPTQRPEGTSRKGIDITPGADNVVANRGAANDGIKPIYQIAFDVQAANLHIQDLRQQIREVFFYNLFLMVASERRSGTKAREIDELHEEKMIILSTVYEQFSGEFLDPAVERIYNILNRRGRLPVPPPEMQGQAFHIEYVSVMAQAMKLVGIGNMDRALAILAQTASIDPTVLDIANLKRFATSYWERLGVDARVMSSPDEMATKEQQRAAQQQQAATQQQAVVQAETAKTLSDAKLEEDNALTQIMGNTVG